MSLQAVIFDCDGVLADSEWASAAAWTQALSRLGYSLAVDEFAPFVGTTDRDLAETFAGRLGTTPSLLLARAEEEMRRVAADGLEAFADALRLLGRLNGYRVAVASNSERWRLDCILASAGLGGRFPVSVASDEVEAPKPDPAVYLRAARLLSLSPVQCLVIEDSPTGIAAARGAGMEVVAVDRGHFARAALAGADRVLASLDDLILD